MTAIREMKSTQPARQLILGGSAGTDANSEKTNPMATTPPQAESQIAVAGNCKVRRTPDEYMRDRVQYKIHQYGKKAFRYRTAYWGMASVIAVSSALVPVLVNLPGVSPLYPTITSLVVVVFVALEGVFHPREHWRNYDLICAVLREEEMRFSTRSGPYAAQSQQEDEVIFKRFVERVEEAIARERAETIVMRTSVGERDKVRAEPGATADRPRD
jgi:hypothetical protein